MALVLRRTAIFVMIVMVWALLAAAAARAQQPAQPLPVEQPGQVQQPQPRHPPNVGLQAALPQQAQPQLPRSRRASCRSPATAPAPSW